MRHRYAPALLLIATAACSRGLTQSGAEDILRAKYPVTVPVKVPGRITVTDNTPGAARIQGLMDNLQKSGWFDISKGPDQPGHTVYTFTPKPGSPVKPAATGDNWLVPAAQAVFVKATHHTEQGGTANVTYQIKLANPTGQFPLFEQLHPAVHLGDTKLRHAVFQKQGGAWTLVSTDESFTEAP